MNSKVSTYVNSNGEDWGPCCPTDKNNRCSIYKHQWPKRIKLFPRQWIDEQAITISTVSSSSKARCCWRWPQTYRGVQYINMESSSSHSRLQKGLWVCIHTVVPKTNTLLSQEMLSFTPLILSNIVGSILLFGTGLNWRESGFCAFFWRWVGRSAHITYLKM